MNQSSAHPGEVHFVCTKNNPTHRATATAHRSPSITMSTTSQKHRNFVAEPMNNKSVTDLAGIGEVLGKRLDSKGFDKVRERKREGMHEE